MDFIVTAQDFNSFDMDKFLVWLSDSILHNYIGFYVLSASAEVTGFHSLLCDSNVLPQIIVFIVFSEYNLSIFTSTIIWKTINKIICIF